MVVPRIMDWIKKDKLYYYLSFTTSPQCFFEECIETTNENLILEFKGLVISNTYFFSALEALA